MPRFVRKPQVVEAFCFDGHNLAEFAEFVEADGLTRVGTLDPGDEPAISHGLGFIPLQPGDWFIRFESGRVSLVDGDFFLSNYEPAEELDPCR